MFNIFKQSYAFYALFFIGALFIFLWAKYRRVEGFTDNAYSFDMYYAEWCPHCHTALPEFMKLGSTQTIAGKKVMCSAIEAEKNPEKVRGKVEGFPTIQLYDPEGNLVATHSGERTKDSFVSFLQKNVK